MMKVGIDVGGTHTDAVIVDQQKVLASFKAKTSQDVTSGIVEALKAVLDIANVPTAEIGAVILGTTHFTNAIVERRGLNKVVAVRIALPSGACIPPKTDWPEQLSAELGDQVYMIHGGHEFNGDEISPTDESEVEDLIDKIMSGSTRTIAITSVFSPFVPDGEEALAQRILSADPNARIVCSHNFGRLGLLERENATLINASLLNVAETFVDSFAGVLSQFNIEAPFFVSQNDGTVMKASTVRSMPVQTFASGPTNSMRGAAYLSGLKDAIVADVGGTTTDFGMLVNGYPRESSWTVEIGEVRSNFRMPDVVPIALGGGSIVSDKGTQIGPESVGHELNKKALCFGGEIMTTTDIACSAGLANIGTSNIQTSIDRVIVNESLTTIRKRVISAIERVKTHANDMPLIVVGGGGFLIDDEIPGISRVYRPEQGAVANAIGAAFSQVGGEIERLYHPGKENRSIVHKRVEALAIAEAVRTGAQEDTISIVDIEEMPVPYMAEDTVRLRIRVVGDLNLSERSVHENNSE